MPAARAIHRPGRTRPRAGRDLHAGGSVGSASGMIHGRLGTASAVTPPHARMTAARYIEVDQCSQEVPASLWRGL